MKIKGRIWKLGDNIDTDTIIPATYLNSTDPAYLAEHCMEPIKPNFHAMIKNGDIILAGKNFGCGSSREHAPLAIKACGISAIIAQSYARIFFRNAVNIGLAVIEHRDLPSLLQDGEELQIDFPTAHIIRCLTGVRYKIEPYPDFIKGIIDAGGLINYYLVQCQRAPK